LAEVGLTLSHLEPYNVFPCECHDKEASHCCGVYGSDEAKADTMAGLKSATGYVRSELGSRVRLRRTPEVVFIEDPSIERGTKVLSLLNQLDIRPEE